MSHQIEKTPYTADRYIAVNPFSLPHNTASIRHALLDPANLDQLPVGTTTIEQQTDQWDNGIPVPIKRIIEIRETKFGKAVTLESAGLDDNLVFNLVPTTETLMTNLGYITDDEEIIAMPSPESVRRAAGKFGVAITFFKESLIPGREYLNAFSNGTYPVSIGSYYEHDISDDHLTGVALGGEPLTEALADIGSRYKNADTESVSFATSKVDLLTAQLRVHLADHFILDRLLPAKRKDVVETMGAVGVRVELIDAIITTARNNALHYGINVKPQSLAV